MPPSSASGTTPSVPQTQAGLNAPDGQLLPGAAPEPNPDTDARLLPVEPEAPLETVAARAVQNIYLAAKRDHELAYGPIGAKQPVQYGGINGNGYSPWMV